jgi:heptosyltransferase-2
LSGNLISIEQQQNLRSTTAGRCDADRSVTDADQDAARATLLPMTPGKWRLVRAFEVLVRFIKPLMPQPLPLEDTGEPPERILVVEYWNLGDLAILVPFLKNLRKRFPGAHISLLISPDLVGFLDGHGLADEFISVRVQWARHFNRWRKYSPFSFDWIASARTVLALRNRRFDWAFSGRMDIRDNLMLWLSGARRRIGYGVGGGGFLLTDTVTPDLSRLHRRDRWLGLLEAVGEPTDPELGGFGLIDAELESTESFFNERGIPRGTFLVGVHPGARNAIRRWGTERFAEVARRLLEKTDAHVLWFSEPGTSGPALQLERFHAVSIDFRRFLAVLSHCRLLVCNDSGPMHLANLLSVPVVAIFGPQRPEWFGPRGPNDRVVIRPEFSCRPCSDYCIFDQPYCLRAISIDEVQDAVESQMNYLRKQERTRVPYLDEAEWVSHV